MAFAPGSTSGYYDGAQPYRLVFRAVDSRSHGHAGLCTDLIVLPPPLVDLTATTSQGEDSGSGYM
ncbi:hypothetical protein EV175_003365, partial [Coemansia sp. RSA 1933]